MPNTVERAKSCVIVSYFVIEVCVFAGWFDTSALQSARSLLGAANLGISQIEKRIERKGKEAKG